jgi:hypothetical protein
MLRFLKLVSLAVLGVWGVLRGVEEGVALWVRRATRSRDLAGMAWA